MSQVCHWPGVESAPQKGVCFSHQSLGLNQDVRDLISHGTPVYRFFKVVYPMFFKVVYPMFFKVVYSMFFHASYVVQEVLLLMFLFLITKKLLFPVHPFQFQQLWNRCKR